MFLSCINFILYELCGYKVNKVNLSIESNFGFLVLGANHKCNNRLLHSSGRQWKRESSWKSTCLLGFKGKNSVNFLILFVNILVFLFAKFRCSSFSHCTILQTIRMSWRCLNFPYTCFHFHDMKFWFYNSVNSCLYSLVQVVQRKLLNGSDPYIMLQWTQWCTFSVLQIQNGSLWGASLLSLLYINKIRIWY